METSTAPQTRWIHWLSGSLLTFVLTFPAGGCTTCQQCDLDAYPAYGGRWHRTDREHGRVGSLFAPAGGQIPYGSTAPRDGQAAGSESGEAPQPTPAQPAVPDDERDTPDEAAPTEPEADPGQIEPELETALLEQMLSDDF